MKHHAFDYYMHDGPAAFRFKLSGTLNGEGVRRLEQDWRTASSVIGQRCLIVDITSIADIDDEGWALLARWRADGAQLIDKSAAVDSQRLRLPRGFLSILVALLWPASMLSATLKPETVTAWESYVRGADAALHGRTHRSTNFLWTFEDDERARKVHDGEIVVAPVPRQNPMRVPGGLIHHWIGAMYVPDVTLDQMLQVTRDYDHYKDFYHSSVIESRLIARTDSDDRFSMLLMNKAFFLKTALDADYDASNVRLDERRFYSVSRTTRVQELEEYGQPGQHNLPEGEGGGYIWKLHGITRMEQRDGGVYVELEAIALSRDIPAMMHFVVDPVVRRVSRNSMLLSLEQTQNALHSATIAKSADPTHTEQLHQPRRSFTAAGSAFAAAQ